MIVEFLIGIFRTYGLNFINLFLVIFKLNYQGPVVQSIFSLMASLIKDLLSFLET